MKRYVRRNPSKDFYKVRVPIAPVLPRLMISKLLDSAALTPLQSKHSFVQSNTP